MRACVIGCCLVLTTFLGGGAMAQSSPPFNMGQPHPSLEIQFPGPTPPVTVEVLTGLYYVEDGTWKGFYADGLLCAKWTGPPLPPGDSFIVDWPQNKPDSHLDHWSNPSIPASESHVPPHVPGGCFWFASWSQRPSDVPTVDCTFTLNAHIHHANGSPDTNYSRQVHLRIAGGPLLIDKKQVADEVVFIRHRRNSGSTDPDTADTAYPWYCTDFDYNPFDYRGPAFNGYAPIGLQKCNVFSAKSLWSQPANISAKYQVNGVGTFLNPDMQLESYNGQLFPQLTTFLQPTVFALVGMNGEMDSTDPFDLSANYFDGFPSGPPYPNPIATDESGFFYALQDELDNASYRHGEDYAKFKAHKPAPNLVNSSSILQVLYPPPGNVGDAFIYSLNDSEGAGMPGIWVQERFIGFLQGYGAALPPDFDTAYDTGHLWITQRKGYFYGLQFSQPTSEDGIFHDADVMYYPPQNPALTLLHEYWAGTNKAAERLLLWPTQPDAYWWRVIPGTSTKKFLGVFVGAFDMIFDLYGVSHQEGIRHSGEGPPP